MEKNNQLILYEFLPDQSLHEVESYLIQATPLGHSQTFWFRSPEETDRIIMICGKVSNNEITWFQISPQ